MSKASQNNNMEPQALRQKSLNFCPEGYYICTGVPGTGFYVRDNFKEDFTSPVPVDYAGKYLEIKKLFRNEISYKDVQEPVYLVEEKEPVNDKDEDSVRIPGCLPGIGVFIVLTFFGHPIIGFIAGIFAGWLFLVLNADDDYDKDRFSNHESPETESQETDSSETDSSETETPNTDSPETVTRKYVGTKTVSKKVVTKVPYTEYKFLTPKVENISDYYISTAETVAASLDDGIPKRILQNYANVLRNPEAGNGFVADSMVDEKTLEKFRDVCRVFEDLILCSLVLKEDFCSDYSADTPADIYTSPASLYVGVFDYIGSQFDVPVFDFGNFRLYLYPSFVIKAYDAFTFDVFGYNDFSLSVSKVWHKYTGKGQNLLVRKKNSGKNWNYCRFARIMMEFGGSRYSVLVSYTDTVKIFSKKFEVFLKK